MLSAITVIPNKKEYSKFTPGLETVTANLRFTGAAAGEQVIVSLVRQDGYGAVDSETKTLTALQATASVTFDTRTIVGDEGFNIVRQGFYTITAVSGSISATSQEFWIGVVTVEEFKNRWLHGIANAATSVVAVKSQPRTVTGVTITDIPSHHSKGIFTLTFTSTGSTLSWNGGTAVPIVTTALQDYVLINADQNEYITVTVDPFLLPSTNKSEQIILDDKGVSDDDFRQDLIQAYNEIYTKCYIYPEPTYIKVPGLTGYSDFDGVPTTYYRPQDKNRWMTIKIPYCQLLSVLELSGHFNESKAFEISSDWFVFNKLSGLIEMVPKSGAVTAWQFYSTAMTQFMWAYHEIPSFWHYRILTGVDTLEGQGQIIREAIAKIAALNALARLGTAYSAGLASVSTSRDGVSFNRSFGNKFPGQAMMEEYDTWLNGDKNRKTYGKLKTIRDRYVGLPFTVI